MDSDKLAERILHRIEAFAPVVFEEKRGKIHSAIRDEIELFHQGSTDLGDALGLENFDGRGLD